MLNTQTLERLGNSELEQYAGNLNAFTENDLIVRERLAETPVEVKMIEPRGICDDKLYDICASFQGKCETFAALRLRIMDRLARDIKPDQYFQWNFLTVLFDGIYIGEPEDLLNYRNGNEQGILSTIKGLGKKIADVKFLIENKNAKMYILWKKL